MGISLWLVCRDGCLDLGGAHAATRVGGSWEAKGTVFATSIVSIVSMLLVWLPARPPFACDGLRNVELGEPAALGLRRRAGRGAPFRFRVHGGRAEEDRANFGAFCPGSLVRDWEAQRK